jgi:6-pyruvoyltetrahydropterin/6-carboxytetrahydropterin synthase
MAHSITVERNRLRFSAAHFTTSGAECEPLHGHNYDVILEITGALTADGWVVDFSVVKRLVADVCGELDHRFLLPSRSQVLDVARSEEEVEITAGGRRYVMPEADVRELDIDNTTAERLAEWIARRLADGLKSVGADNVTGVSVGVEEAPGQAGWFTLALR